ncbi:hypothetical protein Taro_002229 [Colocasia esculenta]|uniref:Uncharacterized protein n=1 Tax=Colocasia esculenta TaxID=4460 RepID=A0A843TC87_COLES|nr:hypothetical protein [Colocasia esculenta]
MVEAPFQKEQTVVQEDVVMEDALIEGEHSVSEEIQAETGVTSGHTDILIEKEDPAQAVVAAATHTDILLESVPTEEENLNDGPLVSTLPDLVSTHCPKLAQNVFWEGL